MLSMHTGLFYFLRLESVVGLLEAELSILEA